MQQGQKQKPQGGLTIVGLAETVLPFRTAEYITSLVDKLANEGVVDPCDLLGTSRQALETKLATHAAFKQSEVADTVSLRKQVAKDNGHEDANPPRTKSPAGGRRPRSPSPRAGTGGRSRSPAKSRRSKGGKGKGRGRGGRDRERSDRRHDRDGSPRGSRPAPVKPQLWAAVENGDDTAVRRMLDEDCLNLEEKYQGWSPLMKAAEEGHTEICKMLLDKCADIEAANNKGRTCLSFAAAPSMKRPTPAETLKLLLERGADCSRKDEQGRTPKERAKKEKRDDAISVFEEFEQNR